MGRKYRKNFFRTNKYQKLIIAPAFLSALILCFFVTGLVSYFNMGGEALTPERIANFVDFVNKWQFLALLYIWIFFIITVACSIIISSSLLGPFERIIKELELVAAGQKKSHITTRDDDELAKRILIPINKIIDRIKIMENLETERLLRDTEDKKIIL